MDPNAAAGVAAGAGATGGSFSSVGSAASSAADILGIQAGLQRGGVLGNAQAAVNAGQLANMNGAFGSHMVNGQLVKGNADVGAGLGIAGGALGIINGIKQGGVQGYGGATVGALQAASGVESLMGNAAMSSTLGAAAGYIAAPLAVYSAIKNWKSGDTAGDAIQGAEAGAAIGSIVPGVGTVIGAVIGGAVGALSSAFGGGKSSTEAGMAQNVNTQLNKATDAQRAQAIGSMSSAQAFQDINGAMNAHNNSAGHSEQIEQVFGKNGVGNMFSQMMPAINKAISGNPSLKGASPTDIYNKVVVPWLKSKGATINPNAVDKNGNNEGKNIIDSITNVIGGWMNGSINSKTSLGVAGQTMNIPAYGG